MEPVLIFTDTDRIKTDKAILNSYVTYLQPVIDQFVALGLTVSISELRNIDQWQRNGNANIEQTVTDLVISKLLDKATGFEFNGVTLSREKLKDMVVVPDIAPILTAIEGLRNISRDGNGNRGMRDSLLQITANVIAKKAGADDAITNEYTHYSQTDRGATLATQIMATCDALNTYMQTIGGIENAGLRLGHDQDFIIPGIKVINNRTFVPSLKWIRNRE